MPTTDEVQAEIVEVAERHTKELIEVLDKLGEAPDQLTLGRVMGAYMNKVSAVVSSLFADK